MSNKLGRHLYKHGLFEGWSEYRYGHGSKHVTLAGTKAAPILPPHKRAGMVERVGRLMDKWQFSPFENEASIRHGLRQSFCLAGHSWRQADNEAEYLVDAAERAKGLERPSLEDGQPYATNGFEYCYWCHGPLDEENKSRRQRFCCKECATMALRHSERKSNAYMGVVLRSAARFLAKEKAPEKPCRYCGEPFRSAQEDQEFCSTRCVSRWQKGDRLLKDIVCEGCGEMTKPAQRGSKFCSHSCASATFQARQRGKLASVRRQCSVCKEDFTPKTEGQKYCSNRCASNMADLAYRQRKGRKEHHLTCRCCGEGFVSKMPWSLYCKPSCRDAVIRFEAGKLRWATPRAVDLIMVRSGARIKTDEEAEAA